MAHVRKKMPVIFRVVDGKVIACFPTVPTSQDSIAVFTLDTIMDDAPVSILTDGRPAEKAEFRDALVCLERIYSCGCNSPKIVVRKRNTEANNRIRRAEILKKFPEGGLTGDPDSSILDPNR